jgi:hypothetical protein
VPWPGAANAVSRPLSSTNTQMTCLQGSLEPGLVPIRPLAPERVAVALELVVLRMVPASGRVGPAADGLVTLRSSGRSGPRPPRPAANPTPKTRAGRRKVGLPRAVVDELAAHLARAGDRAEHEPGMVIELRRNASRPQRPETR